MNRRQYLAASVGAVLTGVGGCLSTFDDASRVAAVVGENHTDRPRTLALRVLADGTLLQADTLELEARERGDGISRPGSAELECGWADEPDAFVVEARENADSTDDDQNETDSAWHALDVANEAESDCAVVTATLGGHRSGLRLRTDRCEELSAPDELSCSVRDP